MRAGAAVGLAAATTLTAVAGVLAVLVIGRPVPAEVAPPAVDQYVAAVETSSDQNRPATLTLTWDAGPTLLSSGGGGLVTEVTVRPGATLGDGQQVLRVDDVAVTACVCAQVFYRGLVPGARGADVKELQRFLVRAVDPTLDVTGRYDPATTAVARRWLVEIGAPASSAVRPELFLRLPGPVVVESVAVGPGEQLPGLGEPLLQGIGSARDLGVESSIPPAPGRYLFTVRGERLPLVLDGDTWRADEPGRLEALAATAADPASSARRLEGRLALAVPAPVVALPPAALVPGSSTACVWVRAAGGAAATRIDGVQVIGAAVSGAALVRADGLAGTEVLIDPSSRVPDARCP